RRCGHVGLEEEALGAPAYGQQRLVALAVYEAVVVEGRERRAGRVERGGAREEDAPGAVLAEPAGEDERARHRRRRHAPAAAAEGDLADEREGGGAVGGLLHERRAGGVEPRGPRARAPCAAEVEEGAEEGVRPGEADEPGVAGGGAVEGEGRRAHPGQEA